MTVIVTVRGHAEYHDNKGGDGIVRNLSKS